MKLKHLLPQVYQGLLPQKLQDLFIVETRATCDSCAMVQGRTRTRLTYKENLKCCTFFPFMPNYLIGEWISQSAGLESPVLTKLASNPEVALPLGFVAPVKFQQVFALRKEGEFGQREDWLCPYFDRVANNCGIWRHRSVVCTTFYCKSTAGSAGQRFWKLLGDYLAYVEQALVEEFLVMKDFSPRLTNELLTYLRAHETEVPPMDENLWKRLWNHYEDPREFYIGSYKFVDSLSKKQFKEILGEFGENLLQKTYTAFERAREHDARSTGRD